MNILLPNGVTVSGVGDTVSVQYSSGLGALTQPSYAEISGTSRTQATESGNRNAPLGGVGGYFLRFYTNMPHWHQIAKCAMDDSSAATDGLTAILTAIADGLTSIELDTDGTITDLATP
jgi:hypothetical protein